MKVVLGFPERYGPYAFSAVSARKDVDPAVAQAFVDGMQAALTLMQSRPEEAVAVAKKEFPTLDPAVVESAVKRMLADHVYPRRRHHARRADPGARDADRDRQSRGTAGLQELRRPHLHRQGDGRQVGAPGWSLMRSASFEAVLALRSGALDAERLPRSAAGAGAADRPHAQAFTVLAGDALGDGAVPARGAPLAGVPVAVKDIVATRDLPTANGSPVYADRVPDADAWVVERLKALGGSVLGKTVTTEFAWRQPGPTRNPWDLAHTPGGSSSGSAAAVAAGLAPLAFGHKPSAPSCDPPPIAASSG